jgi:hypothetical protein
MKRATWMISAYRMNSTVDTVSELYRSTCRFSELTGFEPYAWEEQIPAVLCD